MATAELEAAFEKQLDPIVVSPAAGKSVAGIIKLFVGYLFGTGGSAIDLEKISKLVQKMGQRDGPKVNGQTLVTRGTALGAFHIGTEKTCGLVVGC